MSVTKYLCLQNLDCFLNYTSKAFLLIYQNISADNKSSVQELSNDWGWAFQICVSEPVLAQVLLIHFFVQ